MKLGLGLATLLAAGPAAASVLDIYGFEPRGRAMGNAQTAVADDYTATFYNPAALTRPKKVIAGFGFLASFPRLSIDRAQPPHERQAIPNELPPDFAGFSIGALFPLGGLIDNRVAIGVGVYLPTANLLRGESLDSQAPQFYRYQSLPDKFVVLASAAFEITDWLSLGGGIQTLASIDGDILLDLEIANRRVRQRSIEVDVSPTAAPVAGVLLRPLPGLHLGFGYRGALQLDYAIPVKLVIDDLVDLAVDIRGTVLYVPHELNVGVAYAIEPLALLVSADFGYAFWSQAPDPSPVFALDLSGELAEGLGLGEDFDIGHSPVALNFRDVPQYRVGLEHRPLDLLAVRAGYAWRPSPAPVPTKVYNYIDNDAHILSVGAGVSFADPLEVHQNPIHLDVVYQATLMAEQDVRKDDPDDLVGNYRAGGVIHSLGISFRHEL